jgi:hypothetical protein
MHDFNDENICGLEWTNTLIDKNKIGLNICVAAKEIRANEQVTPSQLGQDQFLLDSFLCSSTLYSQLVQSQIKETN